MNGSLKTKCLNVVVAVGVLFALGFSVVSGQVQDAAQNQRPDERFKADILLVVAHPDDETAVFSYLAKAVLDEKKRVAVVYTTRGDGGGNEIGSERSSSLGMIREIEARRGLAAFGIQNVWFMDGRDVLSQNPLSSLANGQHARLLEQLVRTFRLTRPEVVLTWLPALAGDHGGHQASGILATEAFDASGDPTVFPAQVTARTRDFAPMFEGLRPWQAKKLYFFTDSLWLDLKGKAVEYSNQEISPSQKVTYEYLAGTEASYHLTQEDNKPFADAMAKGELDKYLQKATSVLGFSVFPNPVRLLLGKTHVKIGPQDEVFAGISNEPIPFVFSRSPQSPQQTGVVIELGGPWGFYPNFWKFHGLEGLERLSEKRIYISAGEKLEVPLLLRNATSGSKQVSLRLKTKLPEGWNEETRASRFLIDAGDAYPVNISIATPAKPSDIWYGLEYSIEIDGREVSAVVLKVQLVRGTIPQ